MHEVATVSAGLAYGVQDPETEAVVEIRGEFFRGDQIEGKKATVRETAELGCVH